MESYLLFELQQPGANFGAPAPDWSRVTNPQFNQPALDFFINQGYSQVMADTADFAPVIVGQTFSSQAMASTYAIPQQPGDALMYPRIRQLQRVAYAPAGLSYTQEFERAVTFVSWDKFQRETGFGRNVPFAYGSQPQFVTLAPDRKTLHFYPGSVSGDDEISIWYTPIPTPGVASVPTLVNDGDEPVLPESTHEAIVQWALSKLWLRGREKQQSDDTRAAYDREIARFRQNYLQGSAGETFGFAPFRPSLHYGMSGLC